MHCIKKAMPSVSIIQSAGTSTNGIREGEELSLIARNTAKGIRNNKEKFAKSTSLKDRFLSIIYNRQTINGISTGKPIMIIKPFIHRDKPKPPGSSKGFTKYLTATAAQPNNNARIPPPSPEKIVRLKRYTTGIDKKQKRLMLYSTHYKWLMARYSPCKLPFILLSIIYPHDHI
jgi:hypothetical protein